MIASKRRCHSASADRLTGLQILFGRPNDDPMYDAYPVTEAQRASLKNLLGKPLDPSCFDCFVEARRA
jgi:hypothetical protein